MAKCYLLNSGNIFEIDVTPEATATYEMLKSGIMSVDISNNDEVSQDFYLDGEGYAQTSVTGGQVTLSFSGDRDYTDLAQNYIYNNSLSLGCDRVTNFRWTNPNGDTLEGSVTIANIEYPSGDVNAKGEIGFEIHFNGKPTFTPATP